MKVLEKGTGQKGWSGKFKCTGKGNGAGGCKARLLVEQPDLYRTFSHVRNETDTYVTFTCVECGMETDITESVPGRFARELPSKKEWMERRIR